MWLLPRPLKSFKLSLRYIPPPYSLMAQVRNEVTVSKQALTHFLVGPCSGEVLPMDACHIFLGRPWLFDNHVMDDGHANTYAIKFK